MQLGSTKFDRTPRVLKSQRGFQKAIGGCVAFKETKERLT
jgi:hypothetical protein